MADTISTETKRGRFSFRALDPITGRHVTIDSGKRSEAEAFHDLRRYVDRENRRRVKIDVPLLPRLDHHHKMIFEPVAQPVPAEASI